MTSVDNPLTRTVRTATDVGAPDAGLGMMEVSNGAARPRRASMPAEEGSGVAWRGSWAAGCPAAVEGSANAHAGWGSLGVG